MVTTKQTAFRLDDETIILLDEVAQEYGVNRTTALKMLIRKGYKSVVAEREKVQTGDGRASDTAVRD
jgi:hypothetical protein